MRNAILTQAPGAASHHSQLPLTKRFDKYQKQLLTLANDQRIAGNKLILNDLAKFLSQAIKYLKSNPSNLEQATAIAHYLMTPVSNYPNSLQLPTQLAQFKVDDSLKPLLDLILKTDRFAYSAFRRFGQREKKEYTLVKLQALLTAITSLARTNPHLFPSCYFAPSATNKAVNKSKQLPTPQPPRDTPSLQPPGTLVVPLSGTPRVIDRNSQAAETPNLTAYIAPQLQAKSKTELALHTTAMDLFRYLDLTNIENWVVQLGAKLSRLNHADKATVLTRLLGYLAKNKNQREFQAAVMQSLNAALQRQDYQNLFSYYLLLDDKHKDSLLTWLKPQQNALISFMTALYTNFTNQFLADWVSLFKHLDRAGQDKLYTYLTNFPNPDINPNKILREMYWMINNHHQQNNELRYANWNAYSILLTPEYRQRITKDYQIHLARQNAKPLVPAAAVHQPQANARVYQASPANIRDLKQQMATFFRNIPQVNSRQIKSDINAIISSKIKDIPVNDMLWEPELRNTQVCNRQHGFEKELLNQVFPHTTSKQEVRNLLNALTDPRQAHDPKIRQLYDKLIDCLILTDNIHVYKPWAILFCESLGINYHQSIAIQNNHFYLAGGKPEEIPSNGNCFFHCLNYLLERQQAAVNKS
jgi:hypothetical protein